MIDTMNDSTIHRKSLTKTQNTNKKPKAKFAATPPLSALLFPQFSHLFTKRKERKKERKKKRTDRDDKLGNRRANI